MPAGITVSLLKKVYADWSAHEAPRLGAALAFYTVLSLSPLLTLSVAVAGILFDRASALQQLTEQVRRLVGENGAQAVRLIVEGARQSGGGGGISVISLVVLLVGASGVFGELRSALNRMWDVPEEKNGGIRSMLRDRMLAFGMVLGMGFLLLASLVVSAGLATTTGYLSRLIPAPHAAVVVLDLVISVAGVSVVFALMFKYVPAAQVEWREVWLGAVFTALLFTLGKFLIGIYLAKAAVGSAYGAAGSVIVVIVWVYYTSQIVFLGAEFTHVHGEAMKKTADSLRRD